MRGSLKLGTLAGIGVYIHWSFWLLVGWILFGGLASGAGLGAALVQLGFVAALFGCVVLHELGHALAARRYGIPTRDITLLPIGGVARLERMPERPIQELVVALAGPAVNVVIAAALFFGLTAAGTAVGMPAAALSGNLLADLMWVNVALVVFNMLPAFPMDGGRVLRALLGLFINYERSTQIARRVGKVMAVLLGVTGLLLPNPVLVLIGVFVFFGAGAEAAAVRARARALAGGDQTRPWEPSPYDDRVASSRPRYMIVVEDGRLVDVVRAED